MSDWISTEAHVPDSAETVIVWDSEFKSITLGHYMGGDPVQDWRCLEIGNWVRMPVTYWMSPNPPEEVEEDEDDEHALTVSERLRYPPPGGIVR